MEYNKKHIEYLENEIANRIKSLSSEHYKHIINTRYTGDYEYDKGEMLEWIYDTLKRLYLLIISYLECKEFTLYALLFKERYENKLLDRNFMLEEGVMPFTESDGELLRLREFENFLMPFPAFNVFREEEKMSSHMMLESILKNSHLIVKKTKTPITNEASVYNSVMWFLEFLFPQIIELPAPIFPGKFTYYKGDLHIPELEIVIEYKLIRKNKNPEKYIDEIRTDANNYKNNDSYKVFYAVLFFLENHEYKNEAILSCWKNKEFPHNWKLITVFN